MMTKLSRTMTFRIKPQERRMGIRRRSGARICIGLACCCVCAATAAASSADDCRALSNDGQRLACYDQLFPRVAPGAPTPPPAKVTAPVTTAAPAPTTQAVIPPRPAAPSAADQFGFSAVQQRRAAGGAANPDIVDSISATVTGLQRRPTGEFVVLLDNGQAWRQVERDSWVPPQKGDRVTIRRGLLGSFMLVSAADHQATHVSRER
jgi:hypothetical protein